MRSMYAPGFAISVSVGAEEVGPCAVGAQQRLQSCEHGGRGRGRGRGARRGALVRLVRPQHDARIATAYDTALYIHIHIYIYKKIP